MPMTEDLDAFFDSAEFATDATLNSVPIKVIFDNAYEEGLGVAGTTPICTGKQSDFTAAIEGTAMVIGGVSYKVQTVQPDGTGLVQVILDRQ